MQFGNAQVPYPVDNNPNSGGGPIRRASGALVPARAGNMVYRTPHLVVRDEEPGGARVPGLDKMKFLPDGRLVPQGALGSALGYLNGLDGPSVAFGVAVGLGLVLAGTAFFKVQKKIDTHKALNGCGY